MKRLLILVSAVVLCNLALSVEDPPVFLDHVETEGCVDQDKKCSVWASQGECQSNAAWMMGNCRRSCNSCQGGSRAWTLRNKLAAKYDNKSSSGNSSVSSVAITSMRIDHIEVDEMKQILTMHGRFVATWNDSKLTWDKDQWGVSWLNFYWLQIWTPKIIQTNAYTPKVSSGKTDSKILAANYTGQAYMWTDFSFSAPCVFDYSKYPRDRQTCCFKFDDQRYYVVRFHVSEKAKATAQASGRTTHVSGWKVEKAELTESPYTIKILSDWSKDPFDLETTNCDICVTIRRNADYYSSEIIGPAVAVAVVTLSSFLVGSFWNQILLLIASLSMQLVSMFILNSKLPPSTGTPPRILSFYSFNITITLLLILVSGILLNIANISSAVPPPHCFDKLLDLMKKVFPCINFDTDETKFGDPSLEGSEPASPAGKCFWSPVAKVVKFGLFVLCLVLYAFVMIGCLAA